MVVDDDGIMLHLLKGVPATVWILSSILLLSTQLGPVQSVHEFTAYRMQHFDLYGSQYGSRSSLVNMEGKGRAASMLNRKCVIVRWLELSQESLADLVSRGAGSILVLLPHDIDSVDQELVKEWRVFEAQLLSQSVPIPVYFAQDNEALTGVYNKLNDNAIMETQSSVTYRLLSIFGEDGYQMISDDQKETQPNKELLIHTITGKLAGSGVEHKLPTIAVLAHYDTIGLATSLPSNNGGSGVAALLELARLFSRLYSDPKQRPRFNLLFLLTGGGKFNYFGTKHVIAEQLEQAEELGLSQADYVLCLDELASSDKLYAHVSKPPKEDTKPFQLMTSLNESCPESCLNYVHKKVKLSDDLLAWEHEQFSLKRLSAATISSLPSHSDHMRRSMFIPRSDISIGSLAHNVKLIAEGLARHVYGITCEDPESCGEVFRNQGTESFLNVWLEFLFEKPRSTQVLDREHPVVTGLEQGLSRYVDEVRVYSHKPESSDPEFVAYDIPVTVMKAHRIKPALFDLFLGIVILLYCSVWYLSVQFFSLVWPLIQALPFPVQVRAFKQSKLD